MACGLLRRILVRRAPSAVALAALLAPALLATGCIFVVMTPRYPQTWGPKPVGPKGVCPELSGTYANSGEPAPHCQWLFPIPFSFGCNETHDARFHLAGGDSVRIEMSDSEELRITSLAGEIVLKQQTLSREKDQFRCDDGRVKYTDVFSFPDYVLSRELARAPDGSLLVLVSEDITRAGPGGGIQTWASFWSRHREWELVKAERDRALSAALQPLLDAGLIEIRDEPLSGTVKTQLKEVFAKAREHEPRITRAWIEGSRCVVELDPESIKNVRRFEETLSADRRVARWSGPPDSASYRIELVVP